MLRRFHGPEGRVPLIESLRTQPIIGGGSDLAELVAASVGVEAFEPDSVLIEESATDNDIFFILSGVVSIRVLGREVAVRNAGQHVGEMALIDPSQRRAASVVAAGDEVVAARLSASAFTALADSNPRLWRNLARELAHRLRQRNKFVAPVNPHPVLFVGCSTETLPIASAIQSKFKYDPVVVKVWTDGIFTPSSFPIESLEQVLPTVDFAALILSPDDAVTSRGTTDAAPRDNIIFELGLFMGALGHSRTFLIYPRGIDMKIPTDLTGITPLTYTQGAEDELPTAIASACNEMRTIIRSDGPR